MDYLGMEVYTIFVMLLSLEGWFLLSDFGIGLSLQNFLSEYRVGKKPITPLLQIAYLQSFLAFCLCVFLLFFYRDFLSSFAFGIAIPSTPFVCASFLLLLGALGSVGSRVYYAMHKGAIVHIVQGAASLITWVAIYLLITLYTGENKLLYAVFTSMGIPSLASFVLWLSSFHYLEKKVLWNFHLAAQILRRAKGFWLFSCMACCVLFVDVFVMSRTLPSEEIARYYTLQRVFGVVAFGFTALIQSLWPGCSELMAKGEIEEIRQKMQYYGILGLIVLCAYTLFFVLFGKKIEQLWLGSSHWITPGIVCLFGIYHMIRIVTDLYAMVLQSHSKLGIFLFLVPIQALISIFAQIFLSKIYGIHGILGGLILSYLLTVTWALPWMLRKIQRRVYVG